MNQSNRVRYVLFLLGVLIGICLSPQTSVATDAPSVGRKGPIPKTIGAATEETARASSGLAKSTWLLAGGMLLLFGIYKKSSLSNKQQFPSDTIEIAARKAIGPKTALLVVAAEGKRFLLSQEGDSVSLLAHLDNPRNFADEMSLLTEVEVIDEQPKIQAVQ
jgi:flagellar biogenesis protein FliO